MISFHDWTIEGSGILARQFDNLSRRLEVSGDLPTGWDWAMLVQVGDAMDIIPLTPTEHGVGCTLTEDQLSLNGYYTMQLRGTQGDAVKHSNIIHVFVAESLSGSGKWPTVPSEFLDVERRIADLNTHPPVPGKDGFWMIWDFNSEMYKNSQFPLPAEQAVNMTAENIRSALGYTPADAESLTNLSEDMNILDNTSIKLVVSKTLKVGDNILTDDMVTLGAGWTGSLSDGFTHTSGHTDPLTFAINAINGESYFIDGSIPNTGATLIRLAIGDSYPTDPYNGTSHISWGVKAVGNGNFSIIPESSFSGTIAELSCKKISDDGTEKIEYVFNDIAHAINADHISGFWNVQLGINALTNLVNGSRNIAIGTSSLGDISSGSRNIAIGTFALPHARNAENNINIGADSGLEVANARGCVAIGKSSMAYGTSLTNNVSIGECALYGNKESTSSHNVAIGFSAGYKCTKSSNVFIGEHAGYNCNNVMNTCIGSHAGRSATGWANVSIGAQADTQGYSRSIAIGYMAKATKNNQVVIGEDAITETLLNGDLIVQGSGGVKRQIIFNEDGSVSWISVQ